MKQIKFFIGYFILIGGIVACGGPTASSQQESAVANGSSVESGDPNSDYKPAFKGQTRIGSVKTSTPYKVEQLADGLERPWAVVPLPGGRLLITHVKGYMTLHDGKGILLKKIEGFPEVLARGQGGMLDVAPDPDFASNRMLYWSYSEAYGGSNLMAVAKGRLSDDETKVENLVVIFRATPPLQSSLHFGSRIVFDKDGNMFVSTGERSIPEGRKQAQWLNSGLGKIFKITKEGKAAPGNPFLNTPDAMPEIYSYGNRNVQSLDIHPETGELWEAEFGPQGGDELNLIRPGKNYGWPVITYGVEYGVGGKIGDGIQQKEGMEQPVYYWDPVISPSGMTFYKGDAIPEWKNNLFIGSLSGIHIARLVIEKGKVVGEERLLTDKMERFRDVAYWDGALYAVTDNGKLYKVSRK